MLCLARTSRVRLWLIFMRLIAVQNSVDVIVSRSSMTSGRGAVAGVGVGVDAGRWFCFGSWSGFVHLLRLWMSSPRPSSSMAFFMAPVFAAFHRFSADTFLFGSTPEMPAVVISRSSPCRHISTFIILQSPSIHVLRIRMSCAGDTWRI